MLKNSNSNKNKVTSFPRDALQQAISVREGWKTVGRKLAVPNITVDQFLEKLTEAQERVERAEHLKAARAKAVRERNLCLSELWDLTKRIRNAAKATFGDNSDELDLLSSLQKKQAAAGGS